MDGNSRRRIAVFTRFLQASAVDTKLLAALSGFNPDVTFQYVHVSCGYLNNADLAPGRWHAPPGGMGARQALLYKEKITHSWAYPLTSVRLTGRTRRQLPTTTPVPHIHVLNPVGFGPGYSS